MFQTSAVDLSFVNRQGGESGTSAEWPLGRSCNRRPVLSPAAGVLPFGFRETQGYVSLTHTLHQSFRTCRAQKLPQKQEFWQIRPKKFQELRLC